MNDASPTAGAEWRHSVFQRVKNRARTDRTIDAPLWVQVKNALRETISTDIPSDSRLPSEQALCSLFGVSRPVIREALDALVAENLLVKLPRRGVFTRRLQENVDFLTNPIGVFEDMTSKGHKVTTRTFGCARMPASEAERRMLSLPPAVHVVRIARVYAVDDVPFTFTNISLPGHKAPGFEDLLKENQSIFSLLRDRFGLMPAKAERWFTAVLASPDQAEKLGITAGQPLIGIESVAYASDGTALEYYTAVYNPAVARMHVVTSKTGPTV